MYIYSVDFAPHLICGYMFVHSVLVCVHVHVHVLHIYMEAHVHVHVCMFM